MIFGDNLMEIFDISDHTKVFLYLTLMYEVLTSRLGNTFDSDYGKYDKFLIDKFNISLCLRIW